MEKCIDMDHIDDTPSTLVVARGSPEVSSGLLQCLPSRLHPACQSQRPSEHCCPLACASAPVVQPGVSVPASPV